MILYRQTGISTTDASSHSIASSNRWFTVMIAETVSLGVLSLPAAVSAIGMAPYVHLDQHLYPRLFLSNTV